MGIPTNDGGPDFQKSKYTGKWRRIKPKAPKPAPQETVDRIKRLEKVQRSVQDIEKVQASRLADMDFSYVMDPEATAAMMKISKSHAAKLRKMAVYKQRLATLNYNHQRDVDKVLKEDFQRIKMRLSMLVPKSLEVLADQLELDGDLLSLQAAREILDRDGRMPKTSRVQTQVQPASKIPTANDAIMEEFGVKPKEDTVN